MILPYTRKDLSLLGRLVTRKYPEIAAEVMSSYQPQKPFDTNLSHIPRYFSHYCRLSGAHQELMSSNDKRLLIGCMVSIYSPETLRADNHSKTGLVTTIAKVFNQTHQYVSILMKEAIVHYKAYDDFRERVDELTEKMKGGADG